MSHTGKPAHVAFRITRLSRLVLGDLFVGFHSLVYQCLRLGLKEKHLYVLLGFLCQDIVPLRYGIIIAESLAILAVQLLTLLLLLFLGTGEVLQALTGGVYLEAGLDHLRTSLRFYLDTLLCLPCRFFLCIRVFVPRHDKPGDDNRKTECQRGHECRCRSIGNTQ